MAHRKRPPHKGRHPILITLRARSGLPSFRQQLVLKLVVSLLRWQKSRRYESRFQIAHHSVQTNHLHFIVEAEDGSIRSGMSGFAIAFARRLNELLGRTGAVWDHRYHRRDLTTPTEVKSGLRYVLQNFRKHGWLAYGGVVDEYSSAALFDGWDEPHFVMDETDTEPWTTPARTWLLRTGWKRLGLLLPTETPRAH